MRYFILIPYLLSGLLSQAQPSTPGGNPPSTLTGNQQFTLTGKITGQTSGKIKLYYTDVNGKRVQDSAMIRDGHFAFSGNISEPTMAYLSGAMKSNDMDDPNYTDFFLEPDNMTIDLKAGDFKEAVITGSETEGEYRALEKLKEPISQEMKPLDKAFQEANEALRRATKAKADDVTLDSLKYEAARIHDRFGPYFAREAMVDYDFFAAHPQSYVTAFELRFHTSSLPLDSLQQFYDRFGTTLQQSSSGKEIAGEIEQLKAGSPGSVAKDFTAKDINGQRLTLSDFKGKYVLIDFWASWCVPCRQSMPHVKKLYAQYKDKGFTVIGVSDDDNDTAAWKKAVAKDGTGIWHNVLRGLDWAKLRKNEKSKNDISEKFGIHSLPTKILIDPNGVIIGRYDKGTDDEAAALDKKLATAFAAGVRQKSNNQFVLEGQVTEGKDGWLYLYYDDADGKHVSDSAILQNGRFSFKGALNGPTMAALQLKEKQRSRGNSVDFFMEPSEMTVTLPLNKFEEATFTGSETQDGYAALETKIRHIRERWKIVMDTLSAVNKRSNFQFQELKDWVLVPYDAEINELHYAFFASHPQSVATAYYLAFSTNDLSLDSCQLFYDALGEKTQQTVWGKKVREYIEKLRGGSPGSVAKDFSTKDINGNQLALADFKGRCVLIDFWASWCLPCRKSSPHLLELYKQYHDKGLDIIGVSDDDDKPEAWKKAVAMDGVGIWHNVLRGYNGQKRMKNEPNEEDIHEKYGITELPTKILIDKNGVIIGRYDKGTDDEAAAMDKKLAEALTSPPTDPPVQ
jgi:thiol-disulfide isomerase/thioredoxin